MVTVSIFYSNIKLSKYPIRTEPSVFSDETEGGGGPVREVEGVPADRARAEADAAPQGQGRQGRPGAGQGQGQGQEEVNEKTERERHSCSGSKLYRTYRKN